MTDVVAQHIVTTPGTCGGRPRVGGTRVRVQDIVVAHEVHGQTVEHIAVAYPTLSYADIYAALAYYHDHREDIRRQMAEDDTLVASMQ